MKKSDIGVIAFMYAICICFSVMNFRLPSDAQIYPRFIIIVLASLTTLYLIKTLVASRGKGLASDIALLFKGFLPRQFFPVLAMTLIYLALLFLIGFYPATVLFMIGVLWHLKIKPVTIGITTAAILALVFVTFNLVLKVNLVRGLLFEAIF